MIEDKVGKLPTMMSLQQKFHRTKIRYRPAGLSAASASARPLFLALSHARLHARGLNAGLGKIHHRQSPASHLGSRFIKTAAPGQDIIVMACRLHARVCRALPASRYLTTATSTPAHAAHEIYNAALPSSSRTANPASRHSMLSDQTSSTIIPNPFVTHATCTTYDFPSLKPARLISYPSTHLLLPLRKDILHRAVIFEADGTRQGTASTKWRDDVHGSHRKVRPQKGSGRARLGTAQSPSMRHGGVAFGPHPRDFSTKLQRKVYDLAWRTALSYRYMRGELIVLDGRAEIDYSGPGASRRLREVLAWHKWGRDQGRSLFVTEQSAQNLTRVLASGTMGAEARVVGRDELDVKDLLELGRVVIEKDALRQIFAAHSSDLPAKSDMTVHDISQ